MRRIALAVIVLLGGLAVPVTAAHADPSADPSAPSLAVASAAPGQPVCTVDSTLSGLAGMVATADGYAVVNRGASGVSPKLYLLSNSCQRTGQPISYTGNPAGGARDPRDLAVSADGSTFWVADTGDDPSHPTRSTIAVWKVPANRSTGAIYHFVYPQGDGPYSADAMLLNGDGTPIFVTRALSGPSGIYVPDGQLDSAKNVPLKKVGTFTPQKTGTENKLGPVGQQAVTGGAVAPDGKHVALRTLSDAYQWSVPDGNVVKAVTTTTPVITPLPNEPQGEAIAYSHDGKNFLTVSSQDSGTKVSILSYTPAAAVAATKPTAVAGAVKTTGNGDTRSFFSRLSLKQLTYMVGGVGLVGLLMVIGGVLGIRAARNRPQPVPTKRTRPGERWAADQDPDAGPAGNLAPAPGSEYQQGGEYQGGTYRGGGYQPSGYDDGYADQGWGSKPTGRTYGASGGQEAGRYEDGDAGGAYPRGGQPGAYRGGTYSGGQGGDAYQSSGYPDEQEYDAGGYQQPAVPTQPPGRDSGRDDGIARSHRGRAPKARGSAPARGGYAEEHEGFDDLRRLTEES